MTKKHLRPAKTQISLGFRSVWSVFFSLHVHVAIVDHKLVLTLKSPITTTFTNIFHCFSEKMRLDISSESSASLNP